VHEILQGLYRTIIVANLDNLDSNRIWMVISSLHPAHGFDEDLLWIIG
jgi:hypothetical protein